MTEEQELIQQLQEANTLLGIELAEARKDKRNHPLSRRLCQLGAKLKRDDSTPNTLADDCFTVAMEVTAMNNLAEYCQKSERAAYMELQRIATILDTDVHDLPTVATQLMTKSRTREFSPYELLGSDVRTHNMIAHAASTYGCKTLSDVANLSDDQFLALRNCGKTLLRKIHTALSFGDSEEL